MTNRVCTIDGCGQPLECRGWCQMHYRRWKKYGDPGPAERHYVRPRAENIERIQHTGWNETMRVPALGPCWEWKGNINAKSGYGTLRVGDRIEVAHRVAYRAFKGDFDRDLFVLHACDNRSCINPDHLSLGDGQANMDDMNAKSRGRFLHGEIHGNAKLSDADVDSIRSLAGSGSRAYELADRFGVSMSHVKKIIAGETRQRPAGYSAHAAA